MGWLVALMYKPKRTSSQSLTWTGLGFDIYKNFLSRLTQKLMPTHKAEQNYTFLKKRIWSRSSIFGQFSNSIAAAAHRVRKWEAAAEGEDGLVLRESISSRAERTFGSAPSPILPLKTTTTMEMIIGIRIGSPSPLKTQLSMNTIRYYMEIEFSFKLSFTQTGCVHGTVWHFIDLLMNLFLYIFGNGRGKG